LYDFSQLKSLFGRRRDLQGIFNILENDVFNSIVGALSLQLFLLVQALDQGAINWLHLTINRASKAFQRRPGLLYTALVHQTVLVKPDHLPLDEVLQVQKLFVLFVLELLGSRIFNTIV